MSPKPKMPKTEMSLFGYGKSPIKVIGKLIGEIQTFSKLDIATF